MSQSNASARALFPTAPHLSLRQDDTRPPWSEPRASWELPPWAKSNNLLPILPRDLFGEQDKTDRAKEESRQWMPAFDKVEPDLLPEDNAVIDIVNEDEIERERVDETKDKRVKKARRTDTVEFDDAEYEAAQWDAATRDRKFPSAKSGSVKAAPGITARISGDEQKVINRVRKWWMRVQERVRKSFGDSFEHLLRPSGGDEHALEPVIDEDGRLVDGKRRKRITPSNYSAMEIHGYFGLIDDGSCSQGRLLVCHVPSWVRGQFLDVRAGDEVHAWHVSGKTGGVLTVLDTGRHRYYSPGSRVTTCTICVPEEQWERFRVIE